jgi:hypothetical protein
VISSSISDGVSLGPDSCALIIQPFDSDASDVEFGSILLVVGKGVVQSVTEPKFIVSRIVEDADDLLLIGRLGQVARFSSGKLFREQISGTEDFGFLIDARRIEGRIYVVGMRRQVYVRESPGRWVRADAGVLDESANARQVTGFRSIDGTSANDIYAAGLGGEIWHLGRDRWKQEPSVTNVILEQVRAAPARDVYVAGQSGVIMRGHSNLWSILEHTETEEDFWGLEWFQGDLYLATGEALYCLRDGELPLRQVKVNGGSSFARLRAGKGALWSFGPDEVWWTGDGKIWHSVDVPKAHRKS